MSDNRLYWLDLTKAIGIGVLLYTHLVDRPNAMNNPWGLIHGKFVFSFMISIFFFCSGYVAKYKPDVPKKARIKQLFKTRIYPVLFFNLIGMIVFVLVNYDRGDFLKLFLDNFLMTLIGWPLFCMVTWYLVILFFIDSFHVFFAKYIDSAPRAFLAMLFFFAVGFFLNDRGWIRIIWFVNNSLVPYGIFLAGFFVKKTGILERFNNRLVYLALSLLLFAGVALTCEQNFIPGQRNIVGVMSASWGHPLWFLLTAFMGILGTVCLGHAVPDNRVMRYIGINSLPFFGLNGISIVVLDGLMLKFCKNWLEAGPVEFTLAMLGMVAASLVIYLPFVVLLNRFFPQMIGKPDAVGPIFNRKPKQAEP